MNIEHSIRPIDVGDVSNELAAVRLHIEALPSLPQVPEINVIKFANSTNDGKLLDLSERLLKTAVSLPEIPQYFEPYTDEWLYWQSLAPGTKPRDYDDNFHIDPAQLLFSDNPHTMTRFVSGKFEIDPAVPFNSTDKGWKADSAVVSAYLNGDLTTLTYPPGRVLFFGGNTFHVSQRNLTRSTQTRLIGLIGLKQPKWLR